MNESNAAKSEHDSIRLLLPWYLNKTLSELESARVRQHVDTCKLCQADTELVNTMLDVAVPSQVEVDAGDERLKRVVNRIDAYEAKLAQKPRVKPGFFERLIEQTGSLLQPARLIPAATLAVLASVLVMQFMSEPAEKTYEVRSSSVIDNTQLELRVELSSALSQVDIQRLLNDAGFASDWRVQTGTAIVISLPENITANDMLLLINELESQDGVSSVQTLMAKE